MVKGVIELIVVVVVEVVVYWKFFNQWSIILVVIWSWSHCGRPCEGVALERIQLRVHIDKVPLLVDNLA